MSIRCDVHEEVKSKRCVVDETAKAKRCDVHWWCHHAGCGSSGVFYHTNGAAESKMAREMLCFTIETALKRPWVGAMSALACLGPQSSGVSHGLRRCAGGKCIQRVASRLVMVVSRWLGVVGLRRCGRGKCIPRVANRIVMVESRKLGVILQRCDWGDVHSKSCKSQCNGGVKVDLGSEEKVVISMQK